MSRNRLLEIRLVSGLLFGAGLTLLSCSSVPSDFPTLTLERGPFFITQIEGGEIQAAGGEVVISPRIGGRLKIVYLFPEGEQVDVGDLLVQFDPAEFEREMLDEEGRLEQAKADYEKAKAEMERNLAEIKRRIEQRIAQCELAKLNLQRAQFSSPIDLERAQIELEKAERALAEARQDSAAQEVVNRVDLRKQEYEISQRQERYQRAKENYEKTRIYANRPGIVVYRKIWKPGTDGESKVAVGDQVWGGRALLDIPDLSEMQVLCLVGEVDLKRMAVGQPAFIRLEAFPGPVFHGRVVKLAPMATPQPGAPNVHVFEMIVEIEEQDERLKPGMSAEVEVVVETLEDVLSVPLEAIFEKNGKKVVYRLERRSFKPVEVKLGRQSATAAIIEAGLSEGEVIALKEPMSH